MSEAEHLIALFKLGGEGQRWAPAYRKRQVDRLSRMCALLLKAAKSHSHADEDGGPLGWEAEALAECDRIAKEGA